MPRRIAENTLNASTVQLLNVIRANASAEYQANVPVVTQQSDIPKVGEALFGHPGLANQFINALVNRIAMVRITSKTYNNPYRDLKKGYIEFGETIEEVYVNLSKARIFSAEKAESREFKRTLPEVRAAFHVINWRVQYPITIQNTELRQAFTSFSGVEDLIAKIIEMVYTSAEYDEYLLFKYLLIKAVSHGKMFPVAVNMSDDKNAAIAFRGTSNGLTFMEKKYNVAGVYTHTPKENQHIFMDAQYNAQFDVNVLASAFNMDKADFMGKLHLIDDFTSFDMDRFSVIMAESDGLEEVTDDELALMAKVKAVLVDDEWFQVYDNLNQMTETFVANGLYWNYFYHVWKTLSSSPFANAVVFADSTASIDDPDELELTVTQVMKSGDTVTMVVVEPTDTASLGATTPTFIQTANNTTNGIAVQKYGVYAWNTTAPSEAEEAEVEAIVGTTTYTGGTIDPAEVAVGDTITLTVESDNT